MSDCASGNEACKNSCGSNDQACKNDCDDEAAECATAEEDEEEECDDCRGYLDFELKSFGFELYGYSKGGQLHYTHTFSKSKEFSKDFTVRLYGFPIFDIGFALEGTLGIQFDPGITSVRGNAEPSLPGNRCAVRNLFEVFPGEMGWDFTDTYIDCGGDPACEVLPPSE